MMFILVYLLLDNPKFVVFSDTAIAGRDFNMKGTVVILKTRQKYNSFYNF